MDCTFQRHTYYSEQIQALTARIRELRREIVTCADIEMDCEMVQDKCQKVKTSEDRALSVCQSNRERLVLNSYFYK